MLSMIIIVICVVIIICIILDDGSVEAGPLADALEALGGAEPEAANTGLCAVLHALRALLRNPSELVSGGRGWAHQEA